MAVKWTAATVFSGGMFQPLLDVLWVQVKRGKGRVSAEDRLRLAQLPGRVQVWHRVRGGFDREVLK